MRLYKAEGLCGQMQGTNTNTIKAARAHGSLTRCDMTLQRRQKALLRLLYLTRRATVAAVNRGSAPASASNVSQVCIALYKVGLAGFPCGFWPEQLQ